MATELTDFIGGIVLRTNWQASIAVAGVSEDMTIGNEDSETFQWAFGTGEGEVTNVLFVEEIIDGGQSGTLDLFSLIFPASNFNLSFGFATVKMIQIELTVNADTSDPSSGIRIGNDLTSPFNGWLSPGATHTIDVGGLPYLAGSDTGRAVTTTARNLLIRNLDPVNAATVNVTVFGIEIGA